MLKAVTWCDQRTSTEVEYSTYLSCKNVSVSLKSQLNEVTFYSTGTPKFSLVNSAQLVASLKQPMHKYPEDMCSSCIVMGSIGMYLIGTLLPDVGTRLFFFLGHKG